MFEGIIVVGIIVSIIYVIKVRKDVDAGLNVSGNFTGQEKLMIWFLSFLSPIVFGAIFYYSLKSRLPKKAKYANNISWVAFLFWIVFAFFIYPKIRHII